MIKANFLIFTTLLFICGLETSGQKLLIYTDKNGLEKPVKTRSDWNMKRFQILDSMQAVMGKLPARNAGEDLKIQILDSLKGTNYTRYNIRFQAAANETVTAYLYIPFSENSTKKFPAMLALHGTDALGKRSVDGESSRKNRGYGKELAERGYVVIAPDYPGFGDSENYDFKNDRYQSGTMKGIFNHIRCIDLLQSRKEVDPGRIGVIGHSLGGHNAMFVAAFDTRLKVVISSCGWTLFDDYNIGEEGSKKYGGRLGPYAQEVYMPLFRDKYHLQGDRIPFDFDGVAASIAPRAFFSNSPAGDKNFDVNGVKKSIPDISKVFRLLDAEKNLQVRYPEAGHDFPEEVRFESYAFIGEVLGR